MQTFTDADVEYEHAQTQIHAHLRLYIQTRTQIRISTITHPGLHKTETYACIVVAFTIVLYVKNPLASFVKNQLIPATEGKQKVA